MDPQGLRDGARGIVPLVVPAIPFGVVLGVAINESGLSRLIGWSSSWIVFAGSAQFVAVELLAEGTGVFLAALTIWIVNARHVMYSAAIARRFADAPRWWKLVTSYVLIDQSFALLDGLSDENASDENATGHAVDGVGDDGHAPDDGSAELEAGPDGPVDVDNARDALSYRMGFLFGSGVMAWVLWQIWVLLGVLLGDVIPDSWSLIYAIPILFLTLMLLAIRAMPGNSIPAIAAAAVGGAVAVVGRDMPNGTGLLLGAILGIMAGALTETVLARREAIAAP